MNALLALPILLPLFGAALLLTVPAAAAATALRLHGGTKAREEHFCVEVASPDRVLFQPGAPECLLFSPA